MLPILSRPEQGNYNDTGSDGGGFVDWWDKLGNDRRSALGMGVLTAGLSMMAQGPSRFPTSATENIGKAGLTGLNTYGTVMEGSRKTALENREMALREDSGARDEARLDLDRKKTEAEAARWDPGTAPKYEDVTTGYRPLFGGKAPSSPFKLVSEETAGRPMTPLSRPKYDLGDPVIERKLVDPGTAPGIEYQAKTAAIEKDRAEAGRKLNVGNEYSHEVNLGNIKRVFNKDGSYKDYPMGLSPDKTENYIKMEAEAKARGESRAGGVKIGATKEKLITKMAAGETFTAGEQKAWTALSEEDKLVAHDTIAMIKNDPAYGLEEDPEKKDKVLRDTMETVKNIYNRGERAGKALDKATAAQILKEAGGDKSKARKIAKKRGYGF